MFDIRKGILNRSSDLVFYLIECKSFSKQYLLHLSMVVLITTKVKLRKCQKFIPRNVMSIKGNFIVTLTLTDTIGWRTTIIDRTENVLKLRRRKS